MIGDCLNRLHDLTESYTQKIILLSCPRGMVGEPHKSDGGIYPVAKSY